MAYSDFFALVFIFWSCNIFPAQSRKYNMKPYSMWLRRLRWSSRRRIFKIKFGCSELQYGVDFYNYCRESTMG